MAPMVHGLEAKYFGKVAFTYLDADDSRTRDFQQALGFYYQPELYLLDADGKVLEKWVGFTSEEQLETAFAEHMK
jgi:thioredoxin-like negative regulator of GroEL